MIPDYTLDADDLNDGIPIEYRGAKIMSDFQEALNNKSTILLLGAPGTGKTRQLWAAMLAQRVKRCEDKLNKAAKSMDLPRGEWVRRQIGRDRVTIISEAADLVPMRYEWSWMKDLTAIPDWLMIDDIGFIAPTEWMRAAVYIIANERRAHGRPTVWTTNLTPDQLGEAYSPAIVSRLAGGAVLDLQGDDRRLS